MSVAGEIEIIATRDAVVVRKPHVTWAARGRMVTRRVVRWRWKLGAIAEREGLSSQHH